MAVDYSDVQGLAVYGYGKLVEAGYWLLRVRDAVAARGWLASAPVSTAECQQSSPETALQVAFTAAGLRALGVSETIVSGFSDEFLAGMSGPASRSRRLGDMGDNDPAKWLWGGPDDPVHVIVMLYAKQNLEGWTRTVQTPQWEAGFETITTLGTSDMGGREPFGFVDGISQPEFDWQVERPAPGTALVYANRVALGELLLGYANEYGKYTNRPLLDAADDTSDDLLPAEDQPARTDFGRNGTYLVLRQLEQDVRGFWEYLNDAGGGKAAERYSLGAAMVGRTVDGDPLIKDRDTIEGISDLAGQPQNAFLYDHDAEGVECPFGAHIRRANPRNADLLGQPSGIIARTASWLGIPRPGLHDDLMASTRFHRILRRGREYGTRITPEEALRPARAGEEPRGLQFVCLCANILRQFEFVQNAWLMSTKFNGMSEESDPLLGNRAAVGDCPVTGNFSIPMPGKPPRRLANVPQFITVRGGAYFFMPSLRALRYMARHGKG